MGSNVWQSLPQSSLSPKPADLRFALADGSSAVAGQSICADLHLQTSAGTVVARNQEIFIVDIPLPDILLGRPLLLSLGIDVEQQLCDLATKAERRCSDRFFF